MDMRESGGVYGSGQRSPAPPPSAPPAATPPSSAPPAATSPSSTSPSSTSPSNEPLATAPLPPVPGRYGLTARTPVPQVYGRSPSRAPLAQQRWLLPVAIGVLVLGLVAGGVMAAFALPSGPSKAGAAKAAAPLPGDIADPASPTPMQSTPAAPAVPSAPATPSQVIPAAGTLQTASSQCLDIEDANNGARAVQADCNGSPQQRWQLTASDGSQYLIVNTATGECLDVENASTDDGARILQWTCHNGDNQRWLVRWQGDSFALVSIKSGKCAAVEDDDKLKQRDCADDDSQRWTAVAS